MVGTSQCLEPALSCLCHTQSHTHIWLWPPWSISSPLSPETAQMAPELLEQPWGHPLRSHRTHSTSQGQVLDLYHAVMHAADAVHRADAAVHGADAGCCADVAVHGADMVHNTRA